MALEQFNRRGPPTQEPPLELRGRLWKPLDLYRAEMPTPEGFLLDRVFCRETVGLLAGRRKAGKTYITIKYAACVAGGKQLGHLPVRQGKVLYISQEMPESQIRDRIRNLFSESDLTEINDNLCIVCKAPNLKLDTFDGKESLLEIVQHARADLVVLDALRYVKGAAKENSNDEMGVVLGNILEVAEKTNSCILVVHHLGKPPKEGEGELTGRGASVIEDIPADLLYVSRMKDSARRLVQFGNTRHLGEPPPFYFTLTEIPQEQGAPPGPTLDIVIEAGENPTEQEDLELRKLVEQCKSKPDGLSTKGCQETMSWSKMTTIRRLQRARNLNLLVDHRVGREKRWHVPDEDQADVPF